MVPLSQIREKWNCGFGSKTIYQITVNQLVLQEFRLEDDRENENIALKYTFDLSAREWKEFPNEL